MISISKWYHTGDDDFDKFMDENFDILETLLKLYGLKKLHRFYREYAGKSLIWTGIGFIIAKFGANTAGYYISGLIDDQMGRARWNEYFDRVYDWGDLGDSLELWGHGPGTFLPNPLALADTVANSVVMISEFLESRDQLAKDILLGHATTLAMRTVDELVDGVFNPKYRFAWSPR